MRIRAIAGAGLCLALTAVAACRPTKLPADSPLAPLPTGVEWSLIELEGAPAAPGAGGRPATLMLDATERRASGFTGCNQFGGGYVLEGAEFRFTPLASTKMACDMGMGLEQRYTAALDNVRSYRVHGDTLVLVGAERELARYVRR